MSERVRSSYFIFVRLVLLLAVSMCGVLNVLNETGVSLRILLLVSFYIGLMAAKELFPIPVRRIMGAAGALVCILLISCEGMLFLLPAFFTVYELLSLFPELDYKWYFVPLLGTLVKTPVSFPVLFLVVIMMAVLYIQQNFVVAG